MPRERPFAKMKRFVGFTDEDSANLVRLGEVALPRLNRVVERFYDHLIAEPATRAVLDAEPGRVDRLKVQLHDWGRRLLKGPHDEDYHAARCRIGRVHVRVGLDQVWMFTAMNVLRAELARIIAENMEGDAALKESVAASLHKMLDLELAIMLGTYSEDYIERLSRSEHQAVLKRLAAIGEVATILAHEIRNPLAGISGAIEVLREEIPEGRREVVKEILEQVRRLNERVHDLLMFARTSALKYEEVDPASLVKVTLALLSEEPRMRGVRARVTASSDAGTVRMDRGQMQEVLVNLIRNAAEAMGGEGDLILSVERGERDLILSIEDTGPGVPPHNVREIFKPFFTTRPQGTGLGLSIARRTVEAHGGTLVLERGASGGARFVARFPLEPTR